MSVSYRLHRPKDFTSFIGQKHVLMALQGALVGETQHAYLFAGPRGVGKTSLARIYARALCCEKRHDLPPESLPCNACASCSAHLANRHPDIVELDAATWSGVDQIKERVIAPAGYRPLLSLFRVFVIDEAHMLSGAATAALLKLLEEPPSHLVFLLCSTDPQKIPITLRDRCWQFTLAAGSREEIQNLLSRVAPWAEEDSLRLLARQATGSYRQALTMLDTLVAAFGHEWSTKQVVETLRLPSEQELAALYKAIESKDPQNVSAAIKPLAERMVDTRALILQMQEDCYRGLLRLYGQLDGGFVLGNPRDQIRGWKHLRECEKTLQRDSELALSLAIYGLLHL